MKVQRFSQLQPSLQFSSSDDLELFKQRFFESDLGKLYLAIPWASLVNQLGLKEKRQGRHQLFPPQGRLALMFLKNYSGLSDPKLIEQLNGNVEWQFFCGISLGFARITNFKIVSQIRCELAIALNIKAVEQRLYDYWKPYIAEPEKIVMDATCYESEVRYPTDVKLLWESVEWCYSRVGRLCQLFGLPLFRTKYLKWSRRYVSYSKMRKKPSKKTRTLTRSSLLLLKKLCDFLKPHQVLLHAKDLDTFKTILNVHSQQYALFHKGIKPSNRVVSLNKPYLRPIVRGKEIKAVEFGAKVNKVQIDGISFIEHINFNAFNEGVRFTNSVHKAQSLTHTKVRVAGADAIYATNKNRNFVTSQKIKTDFKPKGPKPKDHKLKQQLRSLITKERASSMEGSFGKDKEHYHLRKIKAKTAATEILWIFFGIHTGNALEIGRRMAAAKHRIRTLAA